MTSKPVHPRPIRIGILAAEPIRVAGLGGEKMEEWFRKDRIRSLEVDTKKGRMNVATIDDVVAWSHTGKGAKVRSMPFWDDLYGDDKTLVCPSGAGMCE